MRHTLIFLQFAESATRYGHVERSRGGLSSHTLIPSSNFFFKKRLLAFPDETDGTVILCQLAVAMCYVLVTTWVRTACVKDI